MEADTIVAVATAGGKAAIGVLRISGPEAIAIARDITGRKELRPRHAHLCRFRDSSREIIDQGIALLFVGPASYTGEDVLELHGHGGSAVVQALLRRALELGARPARPGEFTERAFLNGKIDLVQAEAVAGLIESGTASAARSAARSLKGDLSGRVAALRDALQDLRSRLEAALDFPEGEADSLNQERVEERLVELEGRLSELRGRARQGELLSAGLEIAIVGAPNVGKSTLLNALCRCQRAIVTESPGTTRDPVRAEVNLEGLPARLVDTAGLRDTADPVEREGIRRTRGAIADADLILLVREYDGGAPEPPLEVSDSSPAAPKILIYNKIDRSGAPAKMRQREDGCWEVQLSARTGAGLEFLYRAIGKQTGYEAGGEQQDALFCGERHLSALRSVSDSLRRGRARFREERAAELLAEDLRTAETALGEIIGVAPAGDLLDRIFSRFCLGK